MTNTLIKELTKYYGLTIRRNVDFVDNMQKAIMGKYKHLCTTNEKPMHNNCSTGADSWCKCRVEEIAGKIQICLRCLGRVHAKNKLKF